MSRELQSEDSFQLRGRTVFTLYLGCDWPELPDIVGKKVTINLKKYRCVGLERKTNRHGQPGKKGESIGLMVENLDAQ